MPQANRMTIGVDDFMLTRIDTLVASCNTTQKGLFRALLSLPNDVIAAQVAKCEKEYQQLVKERRAAGAALRRRSRNLTPGQIKKLKEVLGDDFQG